MRYYPAYWYPQGTPQNNAIKLIVGTFPSIVSYSQALFSVWQLTQVLADSIKTDSGVRFENVNVQGNLLTQIKVQHWIRTLIMLGISILSLILVSAVSQTAATAVFNKGEQYITSTTDLASVYNDLNLQLIQLSQLDNGLGIMMLLFAIPDQRLFTSYGGGGLVEIFMIGKYSTYVILNKVTKSLPYDNTTKIFTGRSEDGIASILFSEECKIVSVENSMCNNNDVVPTYIKSWNIDSFTLQQFAVAKPDGSGCSAITLTCTYTAEIRNGSIHAYGSSQPSFRGNTVPLVRDPNALIAINDVLKTIMFGLSNTTSNINTQVAQIATHKMQFVSYNDNMTISVEDNALISIVTSSLIFAEAYITSHPTIDVRVTAQSSYSDYFGGLVVPDWQVYIILIYPISIIIATIYLARNMHASTAIVGGWISSHIAFVHNLDLSTVIRKQDDANNTIDSQLTKKYKDVYIKTLTNPYYPTEITNLVMEERNTDTRTDLSI